MHKTRRRALDRAFDLLGKARDIIEQVLSEEQDAFDILPESIQARKSGEQMSETILRYDVHSKVSMNSSPPSNY